MKIIVIVQEWPCWLALTLALNLPLVKAYIPKEFQSVFNTLAFSPLTDFAALWDAPSEWNSCTVLASGSNKYLSFVLSKLRNHDGSFIYATDTVFKDWRIWDVMHLLQKWSTLCKQQNLESSIVTHADFGGVTSGFHLLSFHHVNPSVFIAPLALPQVLVHILNAASPDAASEIARPDPLDCTPCLPIETGGVLRSEGLFDVFRPHLWVACPCVFKLTGWALQPLLAREHLQAFNIPLDMDDALLDNRWKHCIRSIIQRSITPLVVLAVFHAMWTDKGGDSGNVGVEQPRLTVHETAMRGGVKWSGNVEPGEEIYNRVEDK
jgi:hypothetical protein